MPLWEKLRTAPIVTSFSITVVMKRKKRKLRTFTAEIGEELLFGISRSSAQYTECSQPCQRYQCLSRKQEGKIYLE
ncbi:Uncharacterized protein TCM_000824 [Theobroma cacao]|uniref:Uncharacterized protein n=1 Tax=Theobroma cacao TaxID=3641 RepID=A0A061DP72_THECC|nr:Uncharacterized protein TCM_000824 [Theobroma cacao]